MRILGLDNRQKTIGVAISDPFGWTAQGVEIIRRDKEESVNKSIERIGQIIKEYSVEKIILGYPKNMNNTVGERGEKTEAFKKKLEKTFNNIEVILWDERLSTVGAERSLLEADLSRKKRKNVIDKMAAVFILQGYLDCNSKML